MARDKLQLAQKSCPSCSCELMSLVHFYGCMDYMVVLEWTPWRCRCAVSDMHIQLYVGRSTGETGRQQCPEPDAWSRSACPCAEMCRPRRVRESEGSQDRPLTKRIPTSGLTTTIYQRKLGHVGPIAVGIVFYFGWRWPMQSRARPVAQILQAAATSPSTIVK